MLWPKLAAEVTQINSCFNNSFVVVSLGNHRAVLANQPPGSLPRGTEHLYRAVSAWLLPSMS